MKVAKKFDEDYDTPPLYYFQLLAFAQGLPYDSLGLERQRFKPEVLRRFEGAAEAAKEAPADKPAEAPAG
jgi:heterodisulfide reductase subunit B